MRRLNAACLLALLLWGMTVAPVVAQGTANVTIIAPSLVIVGGNFTANVSVSSVTNFDAANYDISFDPSVLRLNNVTAGAIGAGGNWTNVPIDIWNATGNGTYAVVQNLPGTGGVSGSGSLAILHFTAIGGLGSSSAINLTNGALSNNLAQETFAAWQNGLVNLNILPGDASGDGKINAIDITKVERIIAGLDAPTPGADANRDGNINALDITKVERLIARLD